jgi:aminotransferase
MSKSFINLNAGDPDAEAPKCVIDAVLDAINKGGTWTHYGGAEIPQRFREAVVDYYKTFGPEYEPDNVVPTAGSSAALYIALATVLDKGDEILMWEPSYSGHYNLLGNMGIKMSVAPLKKETGFHPDLDTLEEYVSPKTKAVIICNPNNPTGTVFTKGELKGIGEIAEDHDMAILSDEIYLHFIYDDNVFTSTASLGDFKERTINIMSFSKTFSMTGYRLGYVIAPERFIQKSVGISRITAPRPATFVYAGGIAALRSDLSYVEERTRAYDERRRYFCNAVDGIDGLGCEPFEGAFYAWFDIGDLGLGSDGFCEELLKQENVRLRPGRVFGLNTDQYVRVPLVRPVPVLEEAVERIEKFVKSL